MLLSLLAFASSFLALTLVAYSLTSSHPVSTVSSPKVHLQLEMPETIITLEELGYTQEYMTTCGLVSSESA